MKTQTLSYFILTRIYDLFNIENSCCWKNIKREEKKKLIKCLFCTTHRLHILRSSEVKKPINLIK